MEVRLQSKTTDTSAYTDDRVSRLLPCPMAVRVAAMVIALIAFSISAGCNRSQSSTKVKPANSKTEPPIFQPQGSGLVQVEIQNPNRILGKLCKIDADLILPVKTIHGFASEKFELRSGFYSIQLNDGLIGYAVPALASILNNEPIAVVISRQPEPENGWRWIPAGPAVIGDTLGVGREDERPARIVEVKGCWFAEHEVTNEEYVKFLSAQNEFNPFWIDLESRKCRIEKLSSGEFVADAPSANESFDPGKLPVVMVSLSGAQAYCQWLTKTSGKIHRLPSEVEWEKAARGPNSFVYSYGNVFTLSAANQESGLLKVVGSYPPNGYGLYDMTGNVFEWTSDKFDPMNSKTTLNHSLRGGSFVLDGMYLRNSFRMRQSPTVMTDDIGFRVVREK
ncbi:MAG: formylglycine-generating enzyme family protein [Mariniblastus sp.]